MGVGLAGMKVLDGSIELAAMQAVIEYLAVGNDALIVRVGYLEEDPLQRMKFADLFDRERLSRHRSPKRARAGCWAWLGFEHGSSYSKSM
jgi:hypothetical protein